MKTLTEFSPLTLRKAAAARAAAGGGPRAEAPLAVEASEPAPARAEDAEAAEAAPVENAEVSESAEPMDASSDGGETVSESEATAPVADDPAAAAVAEAVGVPADRGQRLIEALDIIGDRIDQVRNVRVFQGETGPHGAITRGEFHYVIDRVAGSAKRRDDRGRGGDRGGRGERGGGGGGGGGGGRGGFGGERRDKPRGLGSLKFGAKTDDKDPRDERVGRGEMPRAGIGWQLQSAPRDAADRGRGPRGPGRGRPDRDRGRGFGRGPGPGGDRRGPGPGGEGGGPGREQRDARGPGGDRGSPGGDRGGPRGPRPDRGPRPEGAPRHEGPRPEGAASQQPREPRLGPDGQPLPPRSKRPRKPIGPDANGLGPDGKPWDPERRAKRQAEREVTGAGPTAPVENAPQQAPAETPES